MSLVFFDFDGTITKRDTLFAFTLFSVGKFRFIVGLLVLSIPILFQKLKIISSQRAKEIFLTYFFNNESVTNFNSKCVLFVNGELPKIIRKKAFNKIKEHINRGDKVVVVSASIENWISPWASKLGIEVISTKLEEKNGVLTGKLVGSNCNGLEKAKRINQNFNLRDYENIIAYGDSKNDLPMLSLATERYYKPFR